MAGIRLSAPSTQHAPNLAAVLLCKSKRLNVLK